MLLKVEIFVDVFTIQNISGQRIHQDYDLMIIFNNEATI